MAKVINELMESRRRILINTPHTAEASGEIASFNTDMSAKFKELTAEVVPVQDLHGYDHPWPAGGGKNLLPSHTTGGSQSGLTWTVGVDGSVKVNGTASAIVTIDAPNSTWIWDGTTDCWLSGCPSGGGGTTWALRVDSTDGSLNYSSPDYGYGIKLQATAGGNITNKTLHFRIVIRNGAVCNNLVFRPMLNYGLSAEPYQPYSNICPISGWTSATVTRTGKNLINAQGGTITGSGTRQISLSFKAPKSGDYVFSFDVTESTIYYLYASYNLSDGLGHGMDWYNTHEVGPIRGRKAIQLPSCVKGDTYTVTLSVSSSVGDNGCTIADIQVELGETATDYEPYAGTNLMPESYYSGDSRTHNGITFTLNPDRSLTVSGTATGTAIYYFKASSETYDKLTSGKRYWLTGCPQGGGTSTYKLDITYSGGSWNDVGSGALIEYAGQPITQIRFVVYTGVTVDFTFYPLIESEEDRTVFLTSFMESLPAVIAKNRNVASNGTYAESTYNIAMAQVTKGQSYRISDVDDSTYVYAFFYTIPKLGNRSYDNSRVVVGDTSIPLTIEAPIDGYILVRLAASGTSIKIEHIQSVYGGTLDVKKGKLTVTFTAVDMGSIDWTGSSDTYWNIAKSTLEAKTTNNIMLLSSVYPTTNNKGTTQSIFDTASYIRVYDPQYTDAAAFKTGVTGQTLVYELATPIEVNVDPEAIQKYATVGMGTLNWNYNGTRFDAYISTMAIRADRKTGICSAYDRYDGAVVDAPDKTIIFSNTTTAIYIKDSAYTTAADFKTAVTGQAISYELAEPVEIDIDQTAIKTVKGDNNVLADTGEVELEFWAHLSGGSF